MRLIRQRYNYEITKASRGKMLTSIQKPQTLERRLMIRANRTIETKPRYEAWFFFIVLYLAPLGSRTKRLTVEVAWRLYARTFYHYCARFKSFTRDSSFLFVLLFEWNERVTIRIDKYFTEFQGSRNRNLIEILSITIDLKDRSTLTNTGRRRCVFSEQI